MGGKHTKDELEKMAAKGFDDSDSDLGEDLGEDLEEDLEEDLKDEDIESLLAKTKEFIEEVKKEANAIWFASFFDNDTDNKYKELYGFFNNLESEYKKIEVGFWQGLWDKIFGVTDQVQKERSQAKIDFLKSTLSMFSNNKKLTSLNSNGEKMSGELQTKLSTKLNPK